MSRLLTAEILDKFRNFLFTEEKSDATIEKYIRDITAFVKWLGVRMLDKQAVLDYKSRLVEKYAPTTVNSVLASLNGIFEHLNRFDLKVKNLKLEIMHLGCANIFQVL